MTATDILHMFIAGAGIILFISILYFIMGWVTTNAEMRDKSLITGAISTIVLLGLIIVSLVLPGNTSNEETKTDCPNYTHSAQVSNFSWLNEAYCLNCEKTVASKLGEESMTVSPYCPDCGEKTAQIHRSIY